MPFNVAEENIQSRTRGNLLMAIANKFGYILLNTSNKSELATGYGTLYGDMAGGLSILGDVYKMQVYALAHISTKIKRSFRKISLPRHLQLNCDLIKKTVIACPNTKSSTGFFINTLN